MVSRIVFIAATILVFRTICHHFSIITKCQCHVVDDLSYTASIECQNCMHFLQPSIFPIITYVLLLYVFEFSIGYCEMIHLLILKSLLPLFHLPIQMKLHLENQLVS